MSNTERPGPTPLHAAAYNGHAETCALLLEYHADPMARDQDGDTALHLAVMSDDAATCGVILSHGHLDYAAVNDAGKTAMQIALERGEDDVIATLAGAGVPLPPEAQAPSGPLLPLVSADARSLTFVDVPEPTVWLRARIAERAKDIRIATDRLSLRWAPMDFWPGGYVLAMRKTNRHSPSEQFALVWPERDFVLLNWTNEPIYDAAERHEPLFDDANAMAWVRFFFHFVRGQLGRFRIVERIADIIWTDGADDDARTKVGALLQPLRIVDNSADDRVILAATVVFKNALFSTNILLAKRKTNIEKEDGDGTESFTRGQSRLFGEDLLLEDQPFHVNEPPGRYG